MLDFILDLIYPPVCGVCGKIDKNSLCKKCEIQLRKQAVYGIDHYSQDSDQIIDEHLYIFMYGGVIRQIFLNYKFNEKAYLYKTFTNFLLKNEKFVEIIKSYDIIIPVPLSKERRKKRGYNQSGLIAKEISKKLNIPINQTSLKKVKNIVAQSTLNKEQREKNIQGAYILKNAKSLKSKKVLIIDDIYTTGSTINECSKILYEVGTNKIGALTIAKD
ncbi:MAG: ComF family protein [Clostridia bacterium]|nr:ComF family protein [Clostridia bacterium]